MKLHVKQRLLLFLLAAGTAAVFMILELFGGRENRITEVEQGLPPNNTLFEKQAHEEAVQQTGEETGVRVAYVIDGDTVELATGERVRLIGIDAPEFGEPYFYESREKLAEFVLDKEIQMERDVADRDQYGRLLRYLRRDEVFVNLEMVRLGYARSLSVSPNVKYENIFFITQQEARHNDLGIWKLSGKPQKDF